MRVPQKVEPRPGVVEQEQARRARRRDRHEARGVLWDLSRLRRVKNCGRAAQDKTKGVQVRATGVGAERRAGFGGLQSCGSVWACPCCSAKILAGRAAELAAAFDAWTLTGGRVAMVTLTMRHKDGQALAALWDGVAAAWGAVTSGRGWEALHEAYGTDVERVVVQGKRKGQTVTEKRVGYVRVVETTHGANGWHVHVHAALFLPGSTSGQDVDDLGAVMFQRWRDALRSRGFAAPLARRGGLDARLWDGTSGVLGDYFTKTSYEADATRLALELAGGDTKHARQGNRTPFRVLADLLVLGVVDDLALWHEWEAASKGRRQMTWSVGLRGRLLPAVVEQTDEELAAAADLAGDVLVVVTGEGWRRVCDLRAAADLADLAEADDDGVQLRGWLDAHDVGWTYPTPAEGQAAA